MVEIKSPKAGAIVDVFVATGRPVVPGQRIVALDDDNVQKALSDLTAAERAIIAAQKSLSRENENARLATLSADLSGTEAAIVASQEALRLVKDEYTVGQQTTLDLLNAINSVYLARIAKIQSSSRHDMLVFDYAHRRRAIDIVLERIAQERKFWTNELDKLVLKAPFAGTISLLVDRNSLVKRAGVVATIV